MTAGENPVVNESGFYYIGTIHADLEQVGDEPFHDVTLCLYDDRWNVITSTDLGTFSAGSQEVPVEVHTEETPARLIVEHPDFDDRSVFGGVLMHQDSQYVIEYRSELPRPPPSRPGICR